MSVEIGQQVPVSTFLWHPAGERCELMPPIPICMVFGDLSVIGDGEQVSSAIVAPNKLHLFQSGLEIDVLV